MSACPWCREALPAVAAVATMSVCPRCGKSLTDASGAKLRPLDLDYERILADADQRSLLWTKRGTIFAIVLGVVSLGPILAPFAAIVLILTQAFWVRFLVARPYMLHFGGVRRLVTRWIGRLFLGLVAMLGLASSLVPAAGVVVCPLVFGGTCLIFRLYFRFHLVREHRREGVTFLEKVFLVVLAIVFAIGLLLFGLFVWGMMAILPGGK